MLNENNLTLDILKGKRKFSVRENVESLKFLNSNFIVYVEKLVWCLNSIGSISKKKKNFTKSWPHQLYIRVIDEPSIENL